MSEEKHPMTLVGKNKLEQELDHLVKVERENLKKAIAEARAHGDLKENSEYHSAKEKQSHVEGRIMELQHKLSKCEVIDASKLTGPKIFFGATIKLYDEDKDKSVIYQIVGVDESDTSKGKISFTSPLAKALLGKEEGDDIVVQAPKGDINYSIEKVSYEN